MKHLENKMLTDILPRLLLFFWFVWFLIASFSNLFDLLVETQLLSEQWLFRSGNLIDIINIVSIYGVSKLLAQWLFLIVIIIEFTSAFLFLIAFIHHVKHSEQRNFWITFAFILSIMLWMLFLIIGELFVFYAYSGKHLMLLIAELISLWLIIYFNTSKDCAYDSNSKNDTI